MAYDKSRAPAYRHLGPVNIADVGSLAGAEFYDPKKKRWEAYQKPKKKRKKKKNQEARPS